MAFANLNVVAVPKDRTLDDLPIYSGVTAELVGGGPFFKVEQIAEELKRAVLIELSKP